MTAQDMIEAGGARDARSTLRDRKKLATRRTLRQAAIFLVAAHGFDKVTVEDIAEAADVSTRTFFNYFSTKEAALFGADPARIDALRTRLLDRPPAEEPLAVLRRTLVEEARLVADELAGLGGNPSDWLARMKAAHGDPHLQAAHAAHMASVERMLAETLAARLGVDVHVDPYPLLLAGVAIGVMRSVFAIWACGGGEAALDELTDAAFVTLEEGLPQRCAIRRVLGRARAGRSAPDARQR